MKDDIMFSWIPIVACLLLTAAIMWSDGQKLFSCFFLGLTLQLGIFEAISKLQTGHTLSQNFVIYYGHHPFSAWVAMLFTMISMSMLWLHLLSGK